MHNNIAALRHPTIQRKIRRAIWLAKLECRSNELKYGKSACSKYNYVQNRHGHNIMRIDYYSDTGLTVWGDQSRNITAMVLQSLEQSK